MKVDGTSLSMVKGDTEYLSVSCDNYCFQEGDIVEMTVRKSASEAKKQIQNKVTEFENGEAIIKIEHEQTASMTPGIYKYDIQVTFWNGDVKTIVPFSVFNLLQEVTYG